MDLHESEMFDSLEGDQTGTIHVWIDKLMRRLGNPGRYQICMFILLLTNYSAVTLNHVVMGFYGWKFPYVCDPYTGNYTSFQNVTLNACEAELHDHSGINETVTCSDGQWRFTKDEEENTIVTEYDLVCEKEDLINLATTIYFLGVLVGGSTFGYIADRFGRKPTFIVCLFVPVALGVGIRFAPSYVVFVVLRFLIGFCMQGLQTSLLTLYMELFQSKFRGHAGAFGELNWGLTEVAIAGIAYAFSDWKDIQLAICLPSLAALTYIAFVPESYRWQLLKGRPDKAEQTVRKIAKVNKLEFPEETWRSVKRVSLQLKENEVDKSVREYSLMDLIRTPEVRKRTIIICYLWFAGALGYYGLYIQISNLAGDRHLNMLFSGLATVVAGAISVPVIRYVDRRKCVVLYNGIAGIACIIAGALPDDTDAAVDYSTIKKVLAMIGKFGMMGMFCVLMPYKLELFPTVIRTQGFGTSAMFGRLGGLLAPQINTLGNYTAKAFPVILFGSLSLIGAMLVLLCPETRFKKLPDTIEDIENARKMKSNEMTVIEKEEDFVKKAPLLTEM